MNEDSLFTWAYEPCLECGARTSHHTGVCGACRRDKRKKRKCLRCEKMFMSRDSSNRICFFCNKKNEDTDRSTIRDSYKVVIGYKTFE